MGGHNIGSYIVNYRSKRKEAADEERRKKDEELARRPEIIDPSFELFGQRGKQNSEPVFRNDSATSQTSSDDWNFQNRRANTSPEQYQFEPYCEVTPKSSVSSTASKASTEPSQQSYDMGWDSYEQSKPRPQSYLPPVAPTPQPALLSDYNRASTYQTRRHTMYPTQTRQSLPPSRPVVDTKSAYKLGASLTKPFSMNDPLDFWSEPGPTSPAAYRRDDNPPDHR